MIFQKKEQNAKKFDSIKKELLERKNELEQELADLTSQEAVDQGKDSGDQAFSSTIESLKLSLQDAELDEYNRITRALQMIEEGTYGLCTECSQPISEKRLKLYPNAMRCLSCQEQAEEQPRD